MRQVDMAKRLGKPQSFVSKYESGERRLDLLDLEDVCDALGISLSGFATRFEGTRPRKDSRKGHLPASAKSKTPQGSRAEGA